MAKPEKSAKPAEEEEITDAPKKMGRKKLIIIIIIAVTVLVIGGGVAAFFLMKPSHDATTTDTKAAEKAEDEALSKNKPIYVDLGTFTANLVRENGDQYLQVAISLKLIRPDLEEKVKASSPEIMHRVNMLLQSKRASELVTYEDKTRLSRQIKEQVEYVLRLRKTAPTISSNQDGAAPAETGSSRTGISEVLFTSFIIQ